MTSQSEEKEMNYHQIAHCLCCGSDKLVQYMSLGHQPAPNGFHSLFGVTQQAKVPLQLMVCGDCNHSQLRNAVDQSFLFSNYAYRTGVSETLKQHYNDLAIDAFKTWTLHTTDSSYAKVLDIGCNDGTLLEAFKRNFPVVTTGVDMCKVDHDGIDKYIEAEWGTKFLSECYNIGEFDIITATNVLAHTPHPKDFLVAASASLADEGIMVVEFPYGRRMIEELQFDTVYHEHYSYFLVSSFVKLLSGTGLRIADVYINRIHGGSIRFTLAKCQQGSEEVISINDAGSSSAYELLCKERSDGLHVSSGNKNRYNAIQDELRKNKKAFELELFAVHEGQRAVVGFGASAKSTVMTNFYGLDMEYIVDETPCKQGKFSPGMNIPIVSPLTMAEDQRALSIVIMSWNCMRESMIKINEIRKWAKDDIVVTYLPDVRSYTLPGLPI